MQAPRGKKYTYADYVRWEGEERYELIDGDLYMMAPAPSVAHQRASREISRQLANYLQGKACEVFTAPFDVRLNADAGDDTVVQPDITVVCDPEKIKNGKSCKGAPDMVVEILSPSSIRHDQVAKFNQYLGAGVAEYWMVNPEAGTVQVYLLRGSEYIGKNYDAADTIPVGVLEDCQLSLADILPPPPQEEAKEGEG